MEQDRGRQTCTQGHRHACTLRTCIPKQEGSKLKPLCEDQPVSLIFISLILATLICTSFIVSDVQEALDAHSWACAAKPTITGLVYLLRFKLGSAPRALCWLASPVTNPLWRAVAGPHHLPITPLIPTLASSSCPPISVWVSWKSPLSLCYGHFGFSPDSHSHVPGLTQRKVSLSLDLAIVVKGVSRAPHQTVELSPGSLAPYGTEGVHCPPRAISL